MGFCVKAELHRCEKMPEWWSETLERERRNTKDGMVEEESWDLL